jgi:urease accessory protein UreF
MTTLGEIEAAIENLSADEVGDLAAWLEGFLKKRSGSDADTAAVEEAWMAEAKRRWKEIESGSVEAISSARVMEDARRAVEG